MRFLLPIACLVVVFSLTVQTQSTDDGRLETAYHWTEIYLDQAGELLKEARGGDTEAMRELGTLIQNQVKNHQSLAVAWWDTAARRGDEKARLRLVRFFLDLRSSRNLVAAYAWLRATSAEAVTFTWGCKEVTHNEKWFSERMTPKDLEVSRSLADRFLESVGEK